VVIYDKRLMIQVLKAQQIVLSAITLPKTS